MLLDSSGEKLKKTPKKKFWGGQGGEVEEQEELIGRVGGETRSNGGSKAKNRKHTLGPSLVIDLTWGFSASSRDKLGFRSKFLVSSPGG